MLQITTPPQPERLRKRLARTMLTTVGDFGLIEEGDKILVGLSGGKDSYTLFDLLGDARRKAPVRFEIVGVHLDQQQPDYDGAPLRAWLEAQGEPFEILSEDTYSAVIANSEATGETTYCRVCSACVAASSTAPPSRWAATRSLWAIIATTRWRPC